MRKGNKNLSGDGEEGGESRVQNSPKAFGELITILDAIQMFGIAWSKVPESALRNVWKKLMPSEDPIPQHSVRNGTIYVNVMEINTFYGFF